jgi:hypothetical protein
MMKLLATLFALLALMLFAACGGDDDDSSSGDDSDEPAATETTDDSEEEEEEGEDEEDSEPTEAADDEEVDSEAVAVCGVATPEEIGVVLGTEVGEGEDQESLAVGGAACQWYPTDPNELSFVRVEVLKGEGAEGWYNSIEFGGEEEVTGVGDEARWTELTNTLDVIEGDVFVSVQVLFGFGSEGGSTKDAAIEVAELALERVE